MSVVLRYGGETFTLDSPVRDQIETFASDAAAAGETRLFETTCTEHGLIRFAFGPGIPFAFNTPLKNSRFW